MSLGEIMAKAGINTLLGMGTVFIVLIFISFIIDLFKYIAPKKKVEKIAEVAQPSEPVIEEEIEEEEDKGVLVAVITAALYESMKAQGVSPEGYVVRSIKRR